MKNIVIKFHVLKAQTEGTEDPQNVEIIEGANIFVDEVNCHVGEDAVMMEAKASIDGLSIESIDGSVEDAVLKALTEKKKIIKDVKFCTPFIAATDRVFSSVFKAMIGEKVVISLSNSKTKRTFAAIGVIPKTGKVTMDSFTFVY